MVQTLIIVLQIQTCRMSRDRSSPICADHYQSLGTLLSSRVRHIIAKVLLAVSYFLNISWKSQALQITAHIMAGEPAGYLQTWANQPRLALTGLQNIVTIKEIKESALCNTVSTDAKSNALYGQRNLSCITNNIRRNESTHAGAILMESLH